MQEQPSWQNQALRIVVAAEWVALVLGATLGATSPGLAPSLVVAATILGTVFVLAHTFRIAARGLSSSLYDQILVTGGAVLTLGAVTLTGGLSSPFLLLALTPTLLGAISVGHRLGLTTSLLSAGLLGAITMTESGSEALLAGAGAIALFPLTALLVSQIRRLLVESEARAVSLEEASAHTEAEMARLSQTNDLLRRLTDIYGTGQTSPVEVGRSALQAIVDANPGSFATATLFDSQGPVVVARLGTDSPEFVRTQIPLGAGETSSGVVSLATASALTPDELSDIDQLLRPVGVAFANAVLLQEIASAAVTEERLRLARELHDEVGPALAALGLALDATQMQTADATLNSSIAYVREGVGNVVDDLRGIIADLRAEDSDSLVSSIHLAIAGLATPPEITLEIHERRPPKALAMRQILAIATEAVRNAHRHSGAQSITLSGTVDRDVVDIEVVDDGKGFDTEVLPEGHYGVLGMRERADRIGAALNIESTARGTRLRLTWKEKK